ncbi:MAG: glycosyltransferase [Bacteroidia bacterium]|nr:glycosyltransferase [Bacteroidia bacterium]
MKSVMVSILIPVKNAMPFLEACIESILKQSFVQWEVIAVDDGSSDTSLTILKEYENRESRIQVFENTGDGIIDALDLAYSKSIGQWITRMDADDMMYPNRLQIMTDQLTEHGKGHISTGLVQYISESQLGDGYQKYQEWLNSLTKTGKNFTDIYRECVIPSPCWMMFKTDLDKIHAFKPDNYPEDYDLCFRMYQDGLQIIPNDIVLHYWRDHNHRTSRTHEHYADNRFLDLKVHYFLKIDYDPMRQLILWGAGKKGKVLAKKLIEKELDFMWICENPKKTGKHIYGIEMQDITPIQKSMRSQIIIAVAGAAKHQIATKIPEDAQAFYFC